MKRLLLFATTFVLSVCTLFGQTKSATQIANATFDSVNSALNVYIVASGGGAPSPSFFDLTQIYNKTFDAAHGAIQVNLLNAGAGTGNVTATGSPVSGNLTMFSGPATITNSDLSGDCTTSGTLVITCTKTTGLPFASLATVESNTPTASPGNTIVDVGYGGGTVFRDETSGTSVSTITAGQTVEWKWVNGLHTVVSLSAQCGSDPCASLENGRFDSGNPNSTIGHTFTYTFTNAGTYYYYCDVHGHVMQGSVVVNLAGEATILTGTTGSIGGSLLTAGTCATGTAAATGATAGMVAVANPSDGSEPAAGVYIKARVSSNDTVTVSVCAAVASTPTAVTYSVRVIQ